jgi:RNA polymerase sigma-70 factor (TIGR02960 family)
VTAAPLPVSAPEPTQLGEAVWLQPYPDVLLEGLPDQAPGPEARYESREAISLAFITAVQTLPPNQRAVLLLRDVLGYRARETADVLGLSEDAVTSALKRARATMDTVHSPDSPPPAAAGPQERALLERFVAAFTVLDVDALVAMMTDDVWVRMPPLPFEYRGSEAVHRFFTALKPHWSDTDPMVLVPVRANGQPAWGEYLRDPVTGGLHIAGIFVVGLAGDIASAISFVLRRRWRLTSACHARLIEGTLHLSDSRGNPPALPARTQGWRRRSRG